MDDDAEMYIFMLFLVLVTISEGKESENLFLKNSMKSNLQHCNIWELHSDSLNNWSSSGERMGINLFIWDKQSMTLLLNIQVLC